MSSLVLKKGAFGIYRVEFKGTPLDALADFLISDGSEIFNFDDPTYSDDYFISWFRDADSPYKTAGGNVKDMIRKNGKIYVDSAFRKNKNDWSRAFVASAECLEQVLIAWYNIIAKKPYPDEVLLVQEGENVRLIPKWNDCEENVSPAVALNC